MLIYELLSFKDKEMQSSLTEGTHTIKLKFRPKAQDESPDSLIQGRNQGG